MNEASCMAFCAGAPVPLHSALSADSRTTCRRMRVVAMADSLNRGDEKPKSKGFGPEPVPPPPRKEPAAGRMDIMPPSDPRPMVDLSEYVPRGPTMRQDYVDRGLMEPDRDPDAGVLPQVVADRMLRRIVGFAGVPLGTLFAFFAAYFVAKYKYDVSVIPVVVATTTLGCIATAGVGISYGIMSSSWDEDTEGSKLGFDEVKVNVVRARDGLMSMMTNERQQDERAKNMDLKSVNKLRKKSTKAKKSNLDKK
jgi:Photosynthesis affected mutant 68